MTQTICSSCNGAGKFEEDCHRCDGSGRVEDYFVGDGTSEICIDCHGDGVNVVACPDCDGAGFVVQKPTSQEREIEIQRFRKLLNASVLGDDDLRKEIWEQRLNLERIGVSNSEINNIIHDKSMRSRR